MIMRRIVMAIIKRAMTTTTPIIRVEDVEPSSPPEPTVVRVVEGVGGGILVHSSSLRLEIATGHLAYTFISTPVRMTLAPPLTHSSIREMREPLSVSEVPSSLALYIRNDGDSG